MDNIPDHFIIDILSRLNDSTQLARCKCVSKTLNTLARQVPWIHLYCSLDRYTKMRSPETMSKVTPFMNIFDKLISEAEVPIESISLGVDESVDHFAHCGYYGERRRDDLFLAGGPFSGDWMANIGHGLKSITITSFSAQSFDRETNILEALSYNCHSLVELTLKNAKLWLDDMHPMPLLTSLTLKDVAILDGHLKKLMECLPCLQVLILIDIRDTNPVIYHLNLKELKWTVSDRRRRRTSHLFALVIYSPNLTKLELQCNHTRLSLHAPLLSNLNLVRDRAYELNVDEFKNLNTVRLVSLQQHNILSAFPRSSSATVENLTLDSPEGCDIPRFPPPLVNKINFCDVFTVFPNVISLTLGYEFWSRQMFYSSSPLLAHVAEGSSGLKQITLYLVLDDIVKDISFILYVMGICTNLSDIVLFIHRDVDLSAAITFISRCTSQCPKVRLRWGTWKKGTEDCFISNCIVNWCCKSYMKS